jgi:hypothetical protein
MSTLSTNSPLSTYEEDDGLDSVFSDDDTFDSVLSEEDEQFLRLDLVFREEGDTLDSMSLKEQHLRLYREALQNQQDAGPSNDPIEIPEGAFDNLRWADLSECPPLNIPIHADTFDKLVDLTKCPPFNYDTISDMFASLIRLRLGEEDSDLFFD